MNQTSPLEALPPVVALASTAPRVPPVERPSSFKLRLLYRLAPLEFGKIPVAFKVVYARLPGFILRHLRLLWFAERRLSLDRRLVHLVQVCVSRSNGDPFCADMFLFYGLKAGLERRMFDSLSHYEDDPLFSEAERAALAFVEETARHRRVSDQTFARLQRHFGDVQVVELTFLAAVTDYINMISIPLRLPSDDFTGWFTKRRA